MWEQLKPRTLPRIVERKKVERDEDVRMTELSKRIASNGYKVDSNEVAEEILRKLKLVRWARRELAAGAGRDPRGRPAPGR